MKTLSITGAWLLSLASSTIPGLADEPLFKEGDMETIEQHEAGAAPRGWQVLNPQTDTPVIEAEQGQVHEGESAMKITVGKSERFWVRSSRIRVLPNTEYEISIAIMASQGASPFYGVRVYESDGGWNPPDGQPYLIQREMQKDNGREWVVKTARFQTRSNTQWLYIGLFQQSEKQQGSVIYDSISLQPVQ